ncbi:DedA family protein [uncultured Georgenia sp.]|uniref:DedA family protein n=1 Tax=uncultured Georgenia sp. TaxID=378209 RepID=UPI002603895E|nr:DedA family protein [uncultured Georgenia sp.]HLV04727.1 DedA family protein [Actinomycetaceae bacterium]
MSEAMAVVEAWVLGMAESPWILLGVLLLATIDGFFPPVPSESVVIAVAVLAMTGTGPSLWLLILVAALGAFTGDVIAYTIGSKVPVHRMRLFRGSRGQASLAWAGRALASRGTVFILSARFVPIGRVAVNMTAGAVRYPRARFMVIAGIAGVMWGCYSTLLGMGAGVFLHDHPVVAVVVGVIGGVLLGFVVDALIQRLHRRFTRLGAGLADLSRGHVPAEEAEPEPGTGPASPETGAEHCDERTSTPG